MNHKNITKMYETQISMSERVDKYVEKFLSHIPKNNITTQGGSFSPIIFTSFFRAAFKPFMTKYFPFDFKSFLFISNGDHGTLFFDQHTYSKCTIHGFNLYKKEKKEFSHLKVYTKLCNIINKKHKSNHPKNLEKMPDDKLISEADEILKLIEEGLLCTVFSESLDHATLKHLYDSEGGDDFKTFSEIAVLNTIESFDVRKIIALNTFNKNSEPYDFQWIMLDYHDVPPIEKSREAIMNEKPSKEDLERISKLKLEIEANKKKVDKYRKTLNPALKSLLDYAQLCIWMRDARKEQMQKTMTMATNIIRELLKRRNADPRLAFYVVTCCDFKDGLFRRPDCIKVLEGRKKGVLVYGDSKNIISMSYDYDALLKKTAMLLETEEKSEITGSTGCPGNAKGKARIILSKQHFSKFNDGEILITSMTRPEFVPLMKKAKAIVTDEGGITCHAAIVSRELKIPCVIGTRIATKTFKDGDLIEVDANKGVVKIIK